MAQLVAGRVPEPGPVPGAVEDLVQTVRGQREAASGPLQHDEDAVSAAVAVSGTGIGWAFGVEVGAHVGAIGT